MRNIILSFAVLLICAGPALAGNFIDRLRERGGAGPNAPDIVRTMDGRNAAIWLPETNGGPYPLILFSHGFGGCNIQSKFLMKALADHGYVAAAVDHADASCKRKSERRALTPEQPFVTPRAWSSQTYAGRRDDMRTLLNALRADKDLAPKIDFTRIGLAGHSLGGYTVLGLGGGWPDWKMDNVGAVLALSPYCAPYAVHGTLTGMKAPVMYQTGTEDSFVGPIVERESGCYDQTPAPATIININGAAHNAWSDLQPAFRDPITAYAIWFFNKNLKGVNVAMPVRTDIQPVTWK